MSEDDWGSPRLALHETRSPLSELVFVPLQLVLRALAVLLVPVGLVTSLLTPRGFTPSEGSSSDSPDEGVRNATAATAHGSHHGRGGMP